MCFENCFTQHKVIIWIFIVSGWFFVESSASSDGFSISNVNNTDELSASNNYSTVEGNAGKIFLNITLTHSLGVINQSVVYICLFFSIPFLIATILAYIYIPQLHNLHGTCLVCFLICLVFSNILMNPFLIKPKNSCIIGSYLSLCAIHWLHVIGFDMWRNLTSLQPIAPKSFQIKRFIVYTLYACFTPLLSFIGLAQLIVELTSLDMWQGMIIVTIVYLCLTLPIIIVFFVLTALKVHAVRQKIKELTMYEEHFRQRNNLKIKQDNFTMYTRLFIAMAVHICLSNFLYIMSCGTIYADLAAVFLSLEGVWVFALLVMKRNILHLIKNRLRSGLLSKKDSINTDRTNVSS